MSAKGYLLWPHIIRSVVSTSMFFFPFGLSGIVSMLMNITVAFPEPQALNRFICISRQAQHTLNLKPCENSRFEDAGAPVGKTL